MHSMRSGIAALMSSLPVCLGRPTVTSPPTVAKAFGVPIDSDPRSLAILQEWVETKFNSGRMCGIVGSSLIWQQFRGRSPSLVHSPSVRWE